MASAIAEAIAQRAGQQALLEHDLVMLQGQSRGQEGRQTQKLGLWLQ